MSVQRAGLGDAAETFEILKEYFEAIDVVVRDELDGFEEYLTEPNGFWIAREGPRVAGCIAFRALPEIEGACEIKRMYVRPQFRQRGFANALLEAVHEHARRAGFRSIYLDTKDGLDVAINFYERRGYERCARYNDNPEATIFMRRRVEASG